MSSGVVAKMLAAAKNMEEITAESRFSSRRKRVLKNLKKTLTNRSEEAILYLLNAFCKKGSGIYCASGLSAATL